MKKIGYLNALGRLISMGVGVRTAELLCQGVYKSNPSPIMKRVLREAMAQDGFPVPNDAA